jgi:hypothetical protein
MRKLLYVVVAVSMLLMLIVAAAPAMAYVPPPPDTSPATKHAGDNHNVDISGGRGWYHTDRAEQCLGQYATVDLHHGEYSDYLKLTDYHFNIPSDQTIQGIVVTVRGYSTGISSPFVKDNCVRLVKDGEIQSTDRSNVTDWPTGGDSDMVHGTSTDLWGGGWTPADINDHDFGVALSVKNTNTSHDRTAYVDCIKITVYFGAEGQPPEEEEEGGQSITLDLGGVTSGNGVIGPNGASYDTPDGGATLDIPGGTTVVDENGNPVWQIGAVGAPVAFDPSLLISPPEGACILSIAWEFTPSGTTFTPPAVLTIKYPTDLAELQSLCPGVTLTDPPNIVIAYYDSVLGWTVIPSWVDTTNHTVSGNVSHFTKFALYSPPPAPEPTPTLAPVEVPVVTEAPLPTAAPVEVPVVTEAPSPTAAPVVAPSPTEAPTPAPAPAAEANKTNIGVIVGPIVAVIIIALVAYWFLSRRKKAPVAK